MAPLENDYSSTYFLENNLHHSLDILTMAHKQCQLSQCMDCRVFLYCLCGHARSVRQPFRFSASCLTPCMQIQLQYRACRQRKKNTSVMNCNVYSVHLCLSMFFIFHRPSPITLSESILQKDKRLVVPIIFSPSYNFFPLLPKCSLENDVSQPLEIIKCVQCFITWNMPCLIMLYFVVISFSSVKTLDQGNLPRRSLALALPVQAHSNLVKPTLQIKTECLLVGTMGAATEKLKVQTGDRQATKASELQLFSDYFQRSPTEIRIT